MRNEYAARVVRLLRSWSQQFPLRATVFLFVGAACNESHDTAASYARAIRAADSGAGEHEAHKAPGEDDGAALAVLVDASTARGPSAAPAATFSEVYAIINASCGGGASGCHVGGAPAMLAMPDADTAYANLVGVASSKCPDAVRVLAGDPDASVLIGTLDGTVACTQRMPRGRDPLAAAQIDTIRSWIAAGALRD